MLALLYVFGNASARGRRNLHIGNLAAKVGMALQHPPEYPQPVRYALCVVKPVDAQHKPLVGRAGERELIRQACRAAGRGLEHIGVYADGIHAQLRRLLAVRVAVVPLVRRGAKVVRAPRLIPVGIRIPRRMPAKLSVHRVHHIAEVAVVMQPHQVVVQQRLQRIARPRQYPEYVGGGKRHMQKEPKLAAPAKPPQLKPHMEQVKVLNPHKIALFQQRQQRLGKAAIDAAIRAIGVPPDHHARGKAVQQRPKRAVGVA